MTFRFVGILLFFCLYEAKTRYDKGNRETAECFGFDHFKSFA